MLRMHLDACSRGVHPRNDIIFITISFICDRDAVWRGGTVAETEELAAVVARERGAAVEAHVEQWERGGDVHKVARLGVRAGRQRARALRVQGQVLCAGA